MNLTVHKIHMLIATHVSESFFQVIPCESEMPQEMINAGLRVPVPLPADGQ